MSVEQARGLLQKVAEDEEFRARLDSAPHDQKRSILAEAGFGDVKQRDISRALPDSAGGELSDEEIAAVAGDGDGGNGRGDRGADPTAIGRHGRRAQPAVDRSACGELAP